MAFKYMDALALAADKYTQLSIFCDKNCKFVDWKCVCVCENGCTRDSKKRMKNYSDDGAHIKSMPNTCTRCRCCCCSCIKLYNKHGIVLQKQSMWYLSTLLYAGMQFDIFFFFSILVFL